MGKASIIPVIFGVNEPVIFGMPIVLNPYMFVPFLVAPMVNAIIGKFFIDVIGMNAPMYTMPWALPGPIGAFLTTGLDLRSARRMTISFVWKSLQRRLQETRMQTLLPHRKMSQKLSRR